MKSQLLLVGLAGAVLPLISCEPKSPAEDKADEVGDRVEEAVDDASDAVHTAE
ncbi:hypothetical protein [Haloferula sargassicola]